MNGKKYIAMILIGMSCVNYLKAQDLDIDGVASCAGVVIGNASVDYVLGDEKAFNDALDIAYYSYLSLVNNWEFSNDEEIALVDFMLSTNTDKVIMAYNNENYDSALYEEVVGCYRMLGLVLLNPVIQADLANSKDRYDEIIETASTNITRVLNAMWHRKKFKEWAFLHIWTHK